MPDLLSQSAATLAMFGLPQGTELIVILFVGLLLFGRRLPEVGKSLGQGIVEFKKGLKGVKDEIDTAADDPPQPARKPKQISDESASNEANRIESQARTDAR